MIDFRGRYPALVARAEDDGMADEWIGSDRSIAWINKLRAEYELPPICGDSLVLKTMDELEAHLTDSGELIA